MDEDKSLADRPNDKHAEDDRSLSVEERRQEFGAKLRACRVAKGRSERDVIHLTRISPPFLSALEEGRFEELPGQVFGRGFIKNICKAIDVDSAELVLDYDRCWDQKTSKPKSYLTTKRSLSTRLRPEKTGRGIGFVSYFSNYFSLRAVFLWVGLPVAIVATLIALAIKLPRFVSRTPLGSESAETGPHKNDRANAVASERGDKSQAQPSSDALEQSEAKVEPAAVTVSNEDIPELMQEAAAANEALGAPSADKQSQAASKAANTVSLLANEEKGSKLVMKVNDQVEIKVKLDDQASQSQVYQAGEYQFSFGDKAEIFVFDVSKVELSFDGEKLGWYGPQIGEKRLSFFAKDSKAAKF